MAIVNLRLVLPPWNAWRWQLVADASGILLMDHQRRRAWHLVWWSLAWAKARAIIRGIIPAHSDKLRGGPDG